MWQNGELKKYLVLEIEGHTQETANLQILHLQNQEACICHIQNGLIHNCVFRGDFFSYGDF